MSDSKSGSHSLDYQLIHFDLDHILKFASFQSQMNNQSRPNKRRKMTRRSDNLEIEDLQYSDINFRISNFKHISMNNDNEDNYEWVTIVDRSLKFNTDSPINLRDYVNDYSDLVKISDDVYQLKSEDIKLSFELNESLLSIKNKIISKFKSRILLSVNLSNASKRFLEVLRDELAIINLPVPKRNKNTILFNLPLMTLNLMPSNNHAEIEITYKIKIQSNVFNNFQSDLINKISMIVLSRCESYPTIDELIIKTENDPYERISPQLFYKSISNNTAKLPKVERHFDIPELETQLLNFQRKTVNWLLEKESVKYDWSTNRCMKSPLIGEDIVDLISKYKKKEEVDIDDLDNKVAKILNKLCFGWRRIIKSNVIYFFNRYTANIIGRISAYNFVIDYFNAADKELFPQYLPAQGLLAEEMGLGKTVEITALMLMNQRPMDEINEPISIQLQSFGDYKTVIKAKTTLVIAPDSILKQWVDEIVNLAPSLAVTIYGGIGKYSKLDNNAALIAEYLRSFDVVFTTYSTISKELDYALYSSKNKSTRNSTRNRITYTEYPEGVDANVSHQSSEEQLSSAPSSADTNIISDDEALLNEYRSMFQLTIQSKKPKNANEKSNENQAETDYEKALLDEIHLAIKHNKVPSIYKSNDYQSPLMLTHFWRVVLDEVQMVSSKLSRAFQSAALIPRFHAWGVSGTPIKKDFVDLHSILRFLKYQPFCNENSKNSWNLLTSITEETNNEDFIKLWTSIGLRHTKAMVHDDIQLPPQHRILMTIPFTAVEQENYNQLLEECLAAICLDVNGNPISEDWEPSPTVLAYMRSWLVKLRQICCNPQIGKLNLSSKKYKARSHSFHSRTINTIQQLKTLEDVLDDMLTKASDQIAEAERYLTQLYIDIGQFQEYILYPEKALEFLNVGAYQTERIIHRLQLLLNNNIKEYKEYRNQIRISKNTNNNDDNNNYNSNNINSDEEIDDDEIGNREEGKIVKIEKDNVLEKYEEKIKSTRLKIRNWNILLHKFNFLIASCYFQLYDPEYQKKIEKLRIYNVNLTEELKELKNTDQKHRSNELGSLIYGFSMEDLHCERINPLHDFVPNKNESICESEISKFKFLESKYYDLAELTRQKILKSSINNVAKSVQAKIISRGWYNESALIDEGICLIPKNSKKFFKNLPIMRANFLNDYAISMQLKLFLGKLERLINQLNGQASVINTWMEELISILCKPLLSHDKTPDGEEYEESIHDQDRVSCYLHVIGQTLIDRSEFILGSDNSAKIINIRGKQEQRDSELELQRINDAAFLNRLQDKRNDIIPRGKFSFQELVLELKSLEADLKDDSFLVSDRIRIQVELFENLGERVRIMFDNQKLSQVLLQKELTINCNAVFNARIDYFKQLQQISDSVKPPKYSFNQESLGIEDVKGQNSYFSGMYKSLKESIHKAVAKFRYLQTLTHIDDEKVDDEDSLMCIICRSTITIGSLTQCGHKYCKECLEHWLRNNRSCPMCKTSIIISSVYNFTHHKPELKVNQIEDENISEKRNSNLYSIYKPIDQSVVDDIQRVQLNSSYSSKVDMIVKQVLYLKSQDPKVQIVIFSQWQDLLYILGTAFKTMNISYLGSYGTLTPEVGGGRRRSKYASVEQFKDPQRNITCFLLNAKAQASGLTLINATHIFLCEPLVNTSLELQAISRIHRIGQTKQTTVWMFIIENTVEESIVLMSTNKRLQYIDQTYDNVTSSTSSNNTPSSLISRTKEKNLSKAESMTLMNSGGIDTLINKGNGEGESVTNADLWNAFFCARTSKQGRSGNITLNT